MIVSHRQPRKICVLGFRQALAVLPQAAPQAALQVHQALRALGLQCLLTALDTLKNGFSLKRKRGGGKGSLAKLEMISAIFTSARAFPMLSC